MKTLYVFLSLVMVQFIKGAFHEAANLASLYDLPAIFVVENNQYAMGTAVERAAAEPDLYKQALSYDMPSSLVNGMDVFSVNKAMQDHIAIGDERLQAFSN